MKQDLIISAFWLVDIGSMLSPAGMWLCASSARTSMPPKMVTRLGGRHRSRWSRRYRRTASNPTAHMPQNEMRRTDLGDGGDAAATR